MKYFRQTSQRKAIMRYLEGNKDHPTAEDIYRGVKASNPSISLATVYNTVNSLKKRGFISGVPVRTNKMRFDPNMERHHHFICLGCDKIYDIEEPIVVSMPETLKGLFEVVSEQVDLYGYCQDCKTQDSS